MGKRGKSQEPNAPELHQILLSTTGQQPPHNPYYPSLDLTPNFVPPPAYSDLSANANSVPMSRMNNIVQPNASYERLTSAVHQVPPTVVVRSQPPVSYDHRAEKHHRKVRKFNNELFLVALIAIILSIYAQSLYAQRNCVNYLVHQPASNLRIDVHSVRDMHFHIVIISIVLLFLSLVKCASGESKSYCCYGFLVGFTTIIGTIMTGYLAYLAFYSPCSLKLGELASNLVKTVVGTFQDKIPSPDKGVFNESNVIQLAQEDKAGVVIFFLDLFNFIMYLSAFISATMLC